MKIFALIFIFCFSAVAHSSEALKKSGSNQISGFKYLSCGKEECVQLSAQTAWVSGVRGGFSTTGTSELQILGRDGHLKTSFVGLGASYNPDLDLLTVEKSEQNFALYSIRDSKLLLFDGTKPVRTP